LVLNPEQIKPKKPTIQSRNRVNRTEKGSNEDSGSKKAGSKQDRKSGSKKTGSKPPALKLVENEPKQEKKQAAKNKPALRKPKGAKHKTRQKVRSVILNGPHQVASYDVLKTACSCGGDVIRDTIKELISEGLVFKQGRKFYLKSKHGAAENA
jgi:hypothetical protein